MNDGRKGKRQDRSPQRGTLLPSRVSQVTSLSIHDENGSPSDRARQPPRLHFVGIKNAGKTTLVIELTRELTQRGYRVGTIKHSPHEHVLDQPGSDSFRHREAGGSPSAFVTSHGTALFLPPDSCADPYVPLAPHYANCELILVEGDLEARAPKFEVWREGLDRAPLANHHSEIVAIITDARLPPPVTTWPREGIERLADRLLVHIGLRPEVAEQSIRTPA